jgi:hypothetical protein
MEISPEKREILTELIGNLTLPQVSTLIESSREPNSLVGTSTDNANYAFLRKLTEWGFAREVPLDVDVPPEVRTTIKAFAINNDVRPEIIKLLRMKHPQVGTQSRPLPGVPWFFQRMSRFFATAWPWTRRSGG